MFLIHPSKLSTKSSSRIKCKFKTDASKNLHHWISDDFHKIDLDDRSFFRGFLEAVVVLGTSSKDVGKERKGSGSRLPAECSPRSRYARDTHRSNWVTAARATAFSCPWENDAAPVFLSRESSIFRLFCPSASSPKYAKDERPTETLFSSLDHRCRIRFLAFAACEVLSSS